MQYSQHKLTKSFLLFSGNPQSLDAVFLSTGESVRGILWTVYTLHPCSYSLRRTVLLHYSTIISHRIALQYSVRLKSTRTQRAEHFSMQGRTTEGDFHLQFSPIHTCTKLLKMRIFLGEQPHFLPRIPPVSLLVFPLIPSLSCLTEKLPTLS